MLRVFTAFSGYDSQMLALQRLGIECELVGWSEIDKYAIQAHNALFPEYAERNYGDVTKINWELIPDFDLLTWSSPCQDISAAGETKGLAKGSETRSSLIWEYRKAIVARHPKYFLLENVKNLVSNKFRPYFDEWVHEFEGLGYNLYGAVMNAKNYGVPQNRERIFVVAIREDADDGSFKFPKMFDLQTKLKDILQPSVDDTYYLSEKSINGFLEHNKKHEAKGTGFI